MFLFKKKPAESESVASQDPAQTYGDSEEEVLKNIREKLRGTSTSTTSSSSKLNVNQVAMVTPVDGIATGQRADFNTLTSTGSAVEDLEIDEDATQDDISEEERTNEELEISADDYDEPSSDQEQTGLANDDDYGDVERPENQNQEEVASDDEEDYNDYDIDDYDEDDDEDEDEDDLVASDEEKDANADSDVSLESNDEGKSLAPSNSQASKQNKMITAGKDEAEDELEQDEEYDEYNDDDEIEDEDGTDLDDDGDAGDDPEEDGGLEDEDSFDGDPEVEDRLEEKMGEDDEEDELSDEEDLDYVEAHDDSLDSDPKSAPEDVAQISQTRKERGPVAREDVAMTKVTTSRSQPVSRPAPERYNDVGEEDEIDDIIKSSARIGMEKKYRAVVHSHDHEYDNDADYAGHSMDSPSSGAVYSNVNKTQQANSYNDYRYQAPTNNVAPSVTMPPKPLDSSIISEAVRAQTQNYIGELMQAASLAQSRKIEYGDVSNINLIDLVTPVIKEQVKDWMDENLASLVNQVVREEIRRLLPKEYK